MNVVVLQGLLSRPAEIRTLPSGDRLVMLELTTRDGQGSAHSVPVAWPVASDGTEALDAGSALTVLGVVRRRFFRVGGATQSRTEVVAEMVVMSTDRRKVRRLLEQAGQRI